MESSRIFVRGLPPSLKEAEMRQHFSSQSPITDAKFIPHRRIGYVGYKTPEAAAKAVKYFNRSFMRMSRINVELARPVEEMRAEKRRNPSPEEERPEKRREKVDGKPAATNPKFEAFLDTMKASSKGKTWANEDFAAEQSSAVPTAVVDEEVDGESDNDYQHITKKQKVASDSPSDFGGFDDAQTADAKASTDTNAEHTDIAAMQGADEAEQTLEANGVATNADSKTEEAEPTKSDADWLRSRTSRILDLMEEDDEFHDRPTTTQRPTPIAAQPTVEPAVNEGPELAEAGSAMSLEEVSPATPKDEPSAKVTDRLFVRNLPYDASDRELISHFSPYGPVSEVSISMDAKSGVSKGFGFVSFDDPEHTAEARQALDGKSFQGRLLQLIPAKPKRDRSLDDAAMSKLPLKVQNQIKRKAGASVDTFKWNSMFMSADAVVASAASRLGVSKSDVLDPTSSDAAVKQAHAETNAINETKKYLERNGVELDAFNPAKSGGFSDTAMLVKNFPFGTTAAEIREAYDKYGAVKRLIVPPSGTIAIIEMEQAPHARTAFKALAYSKFRDTILYLEKAPKNVFKATAPTIDQAPTMEKADVAEATSAALKEFETMETGTSSTLFVKNLNFSTTTEQLRDLFSSMSGFLSAKVQTRTDAKRPGQVLSTGFGFVEFRTKAKAQAALAAMNGYRLAGHELTIRASHKAADAAEARREEDREKKLASQRTKIIIKNLPFEISKKDVQALFSPYGKLRSVKIPQKFDKSSRGFAFADFVTTKEAFNAMEALKDTHLLGRKLNLSFAAADAVDPEDEIQRMQAKVKRQDDKVAAQKLVGSGGRTKFRPHDGEDPMDD